MTTREELAAATPERPVRVGRYDVTGLIRRGGMGTVYDAIDRDHGARVALKTLTELAPDGLLRFKNEFRAVADLSHRNLVPLYELGCEGDLWFFTMERVDGVDFIAHLRESIDDTTTRTLYPTGSDDLTRRGGRSRPHADDEPTPSRLPEIPALRAALAQLVLGVRELHQAGLLHLDLKPSNVLVDREGRVVVLDFGLVRPIEATATRDPIADEYLTISGTPTWMAPEQFGGAEVGEAADWYAVGLMLYRALTGVHAFARGAPAVTWFAKLHVPPTPPDQMLAGTPADLSTLAMALLDPDPARRPTGETLIALTSGDAAEREQAQGRLARSALVGRERERAALGDAIARAAAGRTSVVHVKGPSGVGKTALLAGLREDAIARDALVLRGRCYERETVPYKAFDGIVDELAAHLGHGGVELALPAWIGELSWVFPVLARVPSVAARLLARDGNRLDIPVIELRRRAVEALRALLESVAARRVLVLEIDDLQWADADSAAMLMKLLEPPTPPGMVIAISFRPEATAAPALAPYLDRVAAVGARDEAQVVAIEVGPLTIGESEELALATLHAHGVSDPEPVAGAIARESGGVPFFVEELARWVAHQQASGGETRTAGVALEHVLARRVKDLPGPERALVEVLAVANSPIPFSTSLEIAGIERGALRALWSLRRAHIVRSTGATADDRIELEHDRMREAVLAGMGRERIHDRHLALGRALAARAAGEPSWLFDAVRHLNAVHDRLAGEERERTARLDLDAGRRARQAAAFALAFDCFHAGTRLLAEDAWDRDYDLALGLHSGAAESAYLSAAWGELDAHVATVKVRARTVLDQLVAWEVQIDAHIARGEYDAAVGAGVDALALLGVALPREAGPADIGDALEAAMGALAQVGPEGLESLPLLADPAVAAANRILARITSAAYFAKPMLLPVIACRLIATSVERGLSYATPYALSIYGIVLNSIGMLPEAHTWGGVALRLLDRFDDERLVARTRHVVHDLVCVWTVPLASTLDDLRAVVGLGQRTGDLEYAAYAAHGYVHNAFYAGRPLEPLFADAIALGETMRGQGQVNALHVHVPFEQLLRCFTGRARDAARLEGAGFTEQAALEAARALGSRSAQCLLPLVMGIARYHFGSAEEASACFEEARLFLDGLASTWHQPMLHQYAALAIYALPADKRRKLSAPAAESLTALRALAEQAPENFAHRVQLVEGARALADGDHALALERLRAVIVAAEAGGWTQDRVIAHELAARAHQARGDQQERARHARRASEIYTEWGGRPERMR